MRALSNLAGRAREGEDIHIQQAAAWQVRSPPLLGWIVFGWVGLIISTVLGLQSASYLAFAWLAGLSLSGSV